MNQTYDAVAVRHSVRQDVGAREWLRRYNRGALTPERHDTTQELGQKRRSESIGAVHHLVGGKVSTVCLDNPLVA